ncbi:hypothetical protein ACO0QE_001763 [Hanseniaspora vineae]
MASSQSPPVSRPGSASPAAVKKKRKAASPFIKRDHLRRQFLKSKVRNGVNGGVKKEEDPDAKANSLLKVKMDPYVKDEYDAIKKTERKDFPTQDPNSNQEDEYDEYPLRAVDADAIMGIKNNIMKFQSKKPMIPEKNLHLPVRLHRKDTRNLQFQLTRAEIVQRQKEIAEYKQSMLAKENGKSGNKNGRDKNEKGEDIFTTASGASITISKPEAPNAKNQANAAATNGTPDGAQNNGNQPNTEDQSRVQEAGKVLYDGQETFEGEFEEGTIDPFADVAPDGGARVKRGGWAGKRKTRKLRLLDENAKKLRFEEYYPWVLEDFDGYNTWVGSYEAGNSDQYVMFAVQKDGSFTMLPADKVYRFTARSQYATLTIEEAEKRFEKNKNVVPRWLMKHLDDIGTTTTRFDRTMRKLKAVDGMKKDADDDDDMDGLFGSRKDNSDNELDYDEEFQDDEEAPIIDGNEEENKESEQRLKKEMLQANAMGLRDAGSFPEDEDEEEDVEIDAEGKEVKKALRKTDLGALYDSDEEKNPYLSESDVEENKKEEENNKSKETSVKLEGEKEATNGKSANEGTPKNKSPTKQRGAPKKVKKIKTICKKYKNGVVLIKADPSILKNFPAGDWNPGKSESSSIQQAPIKTEAAAQQSLGAKEDRPLTEQDIIDIVSSGKITLKELIKELKRRITMDTENRERMRVYVKKLVKISDGFLELNKK